jgi:V-type H+-transporting ATPase subunit H
MESVLLTEGRTYAFLYLSLLKKLQRVDTMQCLLVLITDALLGSLSRCPSVLFLNSSYLDHEERISLFIDTAEADPDFPYAPLLRYVSVSSLTDQYISNASS